MTIYGQTLRVFKRENNECIRNGEKTNLHKIKSCSLGRAMTRIFSRIRHFDFIMTLQIYSLFSRLNTQNVWPYMVLWREI